MFQKSFILSFLLAFGLLAVYTETVYTQEQTYSLQELYNLADKNSKSIRVYNTAKAVADEAAASARSQRLPDIHTQLAFSYNGRGIITDRNFSNLMNVYIPEYGNNFALKVSQVIYAGGAITNAIKLGKMGQDMAELDRLRNRQEIRFMITGQYLDIYKSLNMLEVLGRNIDLTEKVLQNMQNRFEQGTALKNDITRYELQLEMLRLQHAKVEDAYRILNHQLCINVGLDENALVRPDTTILNMEVQNMDESYWQHMVSIGNISLKQTALACQISEKKVGITRSASLPHLFLFAENYLTGPVTIEVPPLNKNFNYWYVGLGIQYSFSSLFKNNHGIRKSRLETRKNDEEYELTKERMNIGVQAAHTDFTTSFTELNTQKKSVELATENYRVINNRYNDGFALITDMIDASNMKLSAELKLIEARINLIYNYYRLKYLTHSL